MKNNKRRGNDQAKKTAHRKSETSRHRGKTVTRPAASTKDSVSLHTVPRSTKLRQYRTPTKRRPDTASMKVDTTDSAKDAYYMQKTKAERQPGTPKGVSKSSALSSLALKTSKTDNRAAR